MADTLAAVRIVMLCSALALLAAACGGSTPLATSTAPAATVARPTHTVTTAVTPAPTEANADVGPFVVNADGSGLRRVLALDAEELAWSPDGASLAFVERVTRDHLLTVVDLVSGNVRRLGPTTPRTLAWAPASPPAILVTAPLADPTKSQLQIVDLATGERHTVAEGLFGGWSPDGPKVWIGGATCDRRDHLRLYDTASRLTTDLAPSHPDAVVSLSPDWRWIAYYADGLPFGSWSDHPDILYIANLDGSGERAIPTGSLPRGSLYWSPDDRWIVYVTRTPEVYLLRTDGSSPPVRIASEDPSAVEWSPDSSRLLLGSAIHLVEHDVTTGADETIATGNIFDAKWSPDGAHIAYVAYSAKGTRVFVYDVVNRSALQVSRAGIIVGARGTAWSPDSTRIVFNGIIGGYDLGPCL